MKNKSGQVTIFIIMAILIVVGIIAALTFSGKIKVQNEASIDTQLFIEKCVRDAVTPSVDRVLENGGRINPDLFLMYQDEKYNYLCYNQNYYAPCINHYPQLKAIIESEIMNDSQDEVKKCFTTLKSNLEKRGFSVSDGAFSWKLEILPKVVEINIGKRIDASQGEIKQAFSQFDIKILSPVYDLAMVAREIVNQEAQYCNFDYSGFMLIYPSYDIKRIDYDENKVYSITDRLTSKEFKFATRSCTSPPGL